MSTDRDVANYSYNNPDEAAGEDDVQPSRARGSLSGATSPARLVTERVRERWLRPVPGESGIEPGTVIDGDGDQDDDNEDEAPPAPRRPRGVRSPLTEDHPSPRCVWEHYRESAAHYGEGMPVAAALYWGLAAVPLAVNMTAAFLHVITVPMGRFWVVALIGAIAWIAIRIAAG